MKIVSVVLLATASCVSAFAPGRNAATRCTTPISMAVGDKDPFTTRPTTNPVRPRMSPSLPWMVCNPILDGSMPGDVGFDPLRFAKTSYDLLNYREAEIKHSRLAMLAAAGWPLSELWDRKIAHFFGLTPVVDDTNRAPSLLNGGLGKVSPAYWIAVLLAAAIIDVYGIRQSKNPDYFPGNLGFDPLGLYPAEEEGRFRMQLAEIKHGRLAMLGITGFAFQEFATKLGVVHETPQFFKPIGEDLTTMAAAACESIIC